MGKLINGAWITDDTLQSAEAAAYKNTDGKFERGTAGFRNWITVDGEAGPTGEGGFKAEAGRYHLFAAINCPWAHRTFIYRNVKKLAGIVGLSVAAPLRTDQGWVFDPKNDRFADTLYDSAAVHQLYSQAVPGYTGRVTVPVLWDTQRQTIVSNESAEIIRMFNTVFNDITGDTQNFYPSELASEIDALNDFIFNPAHICTFFRNSGFGLLF
jgi:putative glutathione S-transferase